MSKILKMTRKIGTHNGAFHCDESLACFLIKLLPQFQDAEIVRTRDEEVLKTCDIVVDVGFIYDHEKLRYDHHQPTFHETLSSIFPKKTFGDIRLSSAGLVYAHYGHEIIASHLNWPVKNDNTDKVFDVVYENFIREIDAIDNGVNMFDNAEPRYTIKTGLSSRVSHLRPAWNEESNDSILYQHFLKAVALTGSEFIERVNFYGKTWLPARSIVQKAFDTRDEIDSSGRIILIESNCPWINNLMDIETELGIEGEILYGIFQDKPNDWRIRALPTVKDGFNLRLGLPKEWRGKVHEDLSAASGVEGCVFAHVSGFIGGNKTREGAIEMARAALKQETLD